MEPVMQQTFQFDEPMHSLSTHEQNKKLTSFFKKLGIQHFIKMDACSLRPKQFVLMEYVSTSTCNVLLEGRTGIGKTFVSIVEILRQFQIGKTSVVILPQDKLIDQYVKEFARKTHLDLREIMALSQTDNTYVRQPHNRRIMFLSQPKIIITTPGRMITDYPEYRWAEIGLVLFDETQSIVKDADAMKLLMQIQETRKDFLSVRLVGISATLASSKDTFDILRYAFKRKEEEPPKIFTVLTDREESGSWDQDIKKRKITLDMNSRRVLQKIQSLAGILILEIEKGLQMSGLFRKPKDVPYWMPDFNFLSVVKNKIARRAKSIENAGELHDACMQLDYLRELHTRLLKLGWFSLLEYYCYTWIQHLYIKSKRYLYLYIPELSSPAYTREKKSDKDSSEHLESDSNEQKEKDTPVKGYVNQSKLKILYNKELRGLIYEIAKDTPYGAVVLSDDWCSLRQHIETLDLVCIFSGNQLSRERVERNKLKNSFLLRSKEVKECEVKMAHAEDHALVRSFFSYALGFMASRVLNSHEKELELIKVLSEIQDQISDVSTFIFTSHTRHAEYLAERLDSVCADERVRPVFAHGKVGAGMNALRKKALQGFNSGKKNILVTTVAFAGTGIDVKDAKVGIHFALADSNNVAFVQANGRVIGRADDPLMFYLYTDGSNQREWKTVIAANKKEIKRRKYVISKSHVLHPDFQIQ